MYREEYSAPESVLFNKAKLKVIFLNIELENLSDAWSSSSFIVKNTG